MLDIPVDDYPHATAPTAEENEAAAPTAEEVRRFTRAYIAAALWSTLDTSGDDDGGNDGHLDANHNADDFDGDSRERIDLECYDFCRANAADIRTYDGTDHDGDGCFGMAGHDFWLTRAGHGCGFWDGDWQHGPDHRLTAASEAAGNREIYADDAGNLIYCKG